MNYEKCYNCGADYGLHQSETEHCPVAGVEETREGHKQKWSDTTFLDVKLGNLYDAAPDMLNALKLVLKSHQGNGEITGVEVIKKVKEAIKKATI